MKKPEMSWDRIDECFMKNSKPVTMEEATERLYAIDSNWTVGAFNQMMSILKKEPS